MRRAAYDYGERITARQLDVRSLTVDSGNGFELTLTDKRQTTKPKDFHQLITISTSKTPSVPVPSSWNAKSKSSVIWGRCYGCRV